MYQIYKKYKDIANVGKKYGLLWYQNKGKEYKKMQNYKVTFTNDEGKTKTVKVKATGIIPAIETAIHKNLNLLGWIITKAEEVR